MSLFQKRGENMSLLFQKENFKKTTTTAEISTTTTITTTTMKTPIEPVILFWKLINWFFLKSDVFILFIPDLIEESYLQSGDGTSQISATINTPQYNYAEKAAFALVKGKLHVFGGWSDGKKVLFCLTNQNNEIDKK